jgi:hypothetical protein
LRSRREFEGVRGVVHLTQHPADRPCCVVRPRPWMYRFTLDEPELLATVGGEPAIDR